MAPAEGPEKCGPRRPTRTGPSCNNAAIDAANTTKGVFVTTAEFTRSAKDYLAKSPKHIVLIDGAELARLMVLHEIGVRTKIQYAVKRIDEDYFDEEDL